MSDLIDDGTETSAGVRAGLAAAAPHPLNDPTARFYVVTPADGGEPVVIDLIEREQHLADRPLRKTGSVILNTAEALTTYLDRHVTTDTEVWADKDKARIVAVLNGHGRTAAGHNDHRATLVLRPTEAWKAWTAASGRLGSQRDFAELVEDRAPDVVTPTSADLLEVLQTFKAAKAVQFESSQRLSTGEVALVYREQVDAQAGKAGQLTIPERFELALAPFEGGPAYKVTARLRYRIDGGQLAIGFVLDRPADVLEAAFADVVELVADVLPNLPTTPPLYTGWPTA